MRIFSVLKDTKGFVRAAHYGVRWAHMITDKAKHKARVLAFWERHGLGATIEAFAIKRSTLFRWRSELRAARGKLDGLNERSKAPEHRRHRIVDHRITAFVITERGKHPRLGKEKLYPLLLKAGLRPGSVSRVGRIIVDLKKANKLPAKTRLSFYGKTGTFRERKPLKKRKKLRRKGYQPEQPGDLVQMDTVVKYITGLRRFILTGIDLKTHVAFAWGYGTLSSAVATDFYDKFKQVSPFVVRHTQTDNGLEFEKHFRTRMEGEHVKHFHNYPKCPKMNAVVERFNRTIQEEFVDQRIFLLRDDLPTFNARLAEWLLWYNAERPHHAHGQVPPLQAFVDQTITGKSNMYWTHTPR